jgi:predicted dehydrogenase
MNAPLKVLHVGVANRGQWPLQYCTPATGFVPTTLCDVNPEALAQARVQTGLPPTACFNDLDQAIDGSKVDCAIVCAPTIYHAPIAYKMMAANIPVLIEKGMAPDWNTARRLTTAVRENKAVVAISQNYRYKSLEKTIWNAIQNPNFSAYLGKVHQLSYTEQRVRPIPRTLNYPFASIWDVSCHHLDNLQFWLGPISDMTAFSWKAEWSTYPYDNNTSAHIRYQNGTHVHYIHTHDAARYNLEIEVHGERGALLYRDDLLTFNERPLEQFGKRPIVPVTLLESDNEGDLLRDFHRYIVEKVEPGISARYNLLTMAACEMMVRSIAEKRTVGHGEMENLV